MLHDAVEHRKTVEGDLLSRLGCVTARSMNTQPLPFFPLPGHARWTFPGRWCSSSTHLTPTSSPRVTAMPFRQATQSWTCRIGHVGRPGASGQQGTAWVVGVGDQAVVGSQAGTLLRGWMYLRIPPHSPCGRLQCSMSATTLLGTQPSSLQPCTHLATCRCGARRCAGRGGSGCGWATAGRCPTGPVLPQPFPRPDMWCRFPPSGLGLERQASAEVGAGDCG